MATGIAAVLSVMALGKLHDKPDGAPTQLNETQRLKDYTSRLLRELLQCRRLKRLLKY